ncbi:MAG: TIGR04282 family arsenosugar biosynthesis glycosyltransferase [Planctomycetota bacterium]
MRTRILVFAKLPEPGQVKTRLESRWDATRAARLYEAFLRDSLASTRRVRGAELAVAYWPPGGREWFASAAGSELELLPQRGNDLAERLERAFRDCFAIGYEAVIVRNSDSPDLPPERIEEAARLLEEHEVVLGPDQGGGYYLVAMRAPYRDLFSRVPMDTETSLEATIAAARGHGLEPRLLAVHPDIDHPEDVDRLWARLGEDPSLAETIPETAVELQRCRSDLRDSPDTKRSPESEIDPDDRECRGVD